MGGHHLQTQGSPSHTSQPSGQLQQLVRVHAPPVTAVTQIQHPGMARVQVQTQGPASPPVLHIPEGFNNYSNNQSGASFLSSSSAASPGPTDTSDGFSVDEGKRRRIILLKYPKKS